MLGAIQRRFKVGWLAAYVSRASATIRLESLGLLRDVRKSEGPRPMQEGLEFAFKELEESRVEQDDDSAG